MLLTWDFFGGCADKTTKLLATPAKIHVYFAVLNEENSLSYSGNRAPVSTLVGIQKLYRNVTVTLWRASELHISKCIYLATILVVVQRVSVINGVYIVLLALALPHLPLQKFVDYLLIGW